MRKILKVEDGKYESANVPMGNENIDGTEYVTFGCPKCKVIFAVPLVTVKMFLVSKRKQAGIV